MLLVRTEKLPEGQDWLYELKLDGYRSIAFKTGGKVYLRSRNNKDFNSTYPGIVKALGDMPDETVIDGEVVALDETGRPSFSALQNHGSGKFPILYYVFDVMVLEAVDVMREPLSRRRELLEQKILPHLVEPIKYSAELDSDLSDLIQSVKKPTRRAGSETSRQPIRGGTTDEGMVENASYRRSGIRHRRIYVRQSV